MKFNEKLCELRKQKGMTQEELASKLYISRTAISKWESGRGYPNIESLKAVAEVFSVSVDELLSPEQMLDVAEESRKKSERHLCDLVFGLVDVCAALLLFLPLFANRAGEIIQAVSLLNLEASPYVKISFLLVVFALTVMGVLTLALQNLASRGWVAAKRWISLTLGGGMTLLFIISAMPYAAAFAFSLLAIKVIMLIKCS
jgi:transcriptional regulator with XRE-family HTH domain